jgi:hypothetical protein
MPLTEIHPCELCDRPADATNYAYESRTEYRCKNCGRYRFNDYLLAEMKDAQHWEQTRERLSMALRTGVAGDGIFNTHLDIMKAIAGFDR